MVIISDLTKDTRPALANILKEAIHDVVEIDLQKPNDDGDLVAYENHTFYYRVVFLFMQKAVAFYGEQEIEVWCKKELLKEVVLPKIEDYRRS